MFLNHRRGEPHDVWRICTSSAEAVREGVLAHVLVDDHGVGRGAEEDVEFLAILPRVDGKLGYAVA